MQDDFLAGVEHLDPVEPGLVFPGPESGVGHYHGLARQHLQAVLVKKRQAILIERIHSHADAESVEDAILRGIGVPDRAELLFQQTAGVE